MSTILEALRKLQADREPVAPAPPRELKSSLIGAGGPRPAGRSGLSPRTVWISGISGGAALGLAVGLFALWPGSEPPVPEAASRVAALPPAARPPAPPPAAATPVPVPAAAASAPATRPRISAPTPRTEPRRPEAPGAGSGSPLQRQPPRRPPTRDSVNPSAPQIERPPDINFQRAGPPLSGTSPPPEAASRGSDRAPSSQSGPVVPLPVDVVPAYEPPRPAPDLRAPVERRRAAEPEPESRGLLAGPPAAPPPSRRQPAARPSPTRSNDDFPELSIVSLRWHPSPERRRATLRVDGVLMEDAQEGDLVDGVLIERIDPDTVVFRVGGDRKQVSLGS